MKSGVIYIIPQMKGDLHPSVWRWFTENHPRWWKTFRSASEVRAACRIRFGEMTSALVVGRAAKSAFERIEIEGLEA